MGVMIFRNYKKTQEEKIRFITKYDLLEFYGNREVVDFLKVGFVDARHKLIEMITW